jgi:cytochrome c-type biogenesis protein CcmH/NrfG
MIRRQAAVTARFLLLFLLVCGLTYGQVDKITIPAGTPEDQALEEITRQPDPEKRVPMYQDFFQKFASNPAAIAYANWQLSQYYLSAGDLQKATEYGDKAAAASPRNPDILTSQVVIAQKSSDNARVFKYAAQGGEAFDSIEKQPKPADMSDADFASKVASEKADNQSAYDFFESAAFSAIAAENDAKTRMDYIEKFTPVFQKSKFDDQVGSYAMWSLSQLKDTRRLTAYAEKALAANPNSLPPLLMLANSYADSGEPGSLEKAVTFAHRAIVAAKADDPAADKTRRVSAGVAHSALGRVYAKQEKTLPSITELKSATALLKGQDDQQYAVAAYYLGWDYAKLNRLNEARAVLTDASAIPGPVQQPVKDLLLKVNSARAGKK